MFPGKNLMLDQMEEALQIKHTNASLLTPEDRLTIILHKLIPPVAEMQGIIKDEMDKRDALNHGVIKLPRGFSS